ncbi:MAG: FHA domain-containing protein [Proteobacteria bacterium]|nr:FHA domain-containing protein [Pseudomonadota bacterium]
MANKQKINIDWEDLKEAPVQDNPRVFPGLSKEGQQNFSLDVSGGKSKKNPIYALSEGIALPRAIAGFIGAAVSWIFTESLMNQDSGATSYLAVIMSSMSWFAVIGAFVAGALRSSEDIYVGRTEAAIRSFFFGALIGTITGAISGLIAQLLYSLLGGGMRGGDLQQILARTLGFGIAGTLLGLGISIPSGIRKKIKAATLGGLVGGLAGGFCFDTLGKLLAAAMGGTGGISRMLGLVLTGFSIGYGMGITENVLRDAWVQVVAGPFKGKQFILFKKDSWIGRNPYCDIVLVKDTYVADQHCVIRETPNGYRLEVNRSIGAQVLINGISVTEKFLQPGDNVQVGHTQFVFQASTGKKG